MERAERGKETLRKRSGVDRIVYFCTPEEDYLFQRGSSGEERRPPLYCDSVVIVVYGSGKLRTMKASLRQADQPAHGIPPSLSLSLCRGFVVHEYMYSGGMLRLLVFTTARGKERADRQRARSMLIFSA